MIKRLPLTIFIVSIFWINFPIFSAITPSISDEQKLLLDRLPPDQRQNVLGKMGALDDSQAEIEEILDGKNLLIERPDLKNLEKTEGYCKECIYGYNLFRFSPTTFAPSSKITVPASYTVGPGDVFRVNYYGSQTASVKVAIERDGSFQLPFLGPVNLAGLKFDEAKKLLQRRVQSELVGTEVSITMDSLRSISVYILGEAYKPGSYTVSALSTVTNVLFATGGVNEFGSLRNIQIKRNGKIIGSYDFYDLLLKGDTSSDFRLEDGDTVFIPFISNTVSINGAFNRPDNYEFILGETIKDAIELAGGFNSQVGNYKSLELDYIDPGSDKRNLKKLSIDEDLSRALNNRDALTVNSVSGISSEFIKISGQVKYPGTYSINSNERILDVINRAGGYTAKAFSEGAVFTRTLVAKQQKNAFRRTASSLETSIANAISSGSLSNIDEFSLAPISKIIKDLREIEPIGRQVVDLNYLRIKTDPLKNFMLQDGDSLFVPIRLSAISISGEVLNPVSVMFSPGRPLKDYLSMAGGMTSTADESRIMVIQPDGSSFIYQNRFFGTANSILPGAAIVVQRNPRPFDAIKITQIVTPILADLATSAAAIAAISD